MLQRARQLVTATLLAAAAVASARAQIQDPNHMVSGPPKPPAPRHAPSELDNIGSIWQYTQPPPKGDAHALLANPHFLLMLGEAFPQQQAMWGNHEPLRSLIPVFTQKYATVIGTGNRYLTLDGCVPRFCPAHGMLWIDMKPRRGDEKPLMIFAAEHWEEQGRAVDSAKAPYDLWLFTDRQLDALNLPEAFVNAIAEWDKRLAAQGRGVAHIRQAILIEPDGSPQPLPPQVAGANRIPPQLDTLTPPDKDDDTQ